MSETPRTDNNLTAIYKVGGNAEVVGATKVYLKHCALSKTKPNADWTRFIEGA